MRPGPSRETLIRVHRSDNRALVTSLDVSISQDVDYFSALDGTIQFAFPDLSKELVEKEVTILTFHSIAEIYLKPLHCLVCNRIHFRNANSINNTFEAVLV